MTSGTRFSWLIVLSLGVTGSCFQSPARNYAIDKASPNGAYRVNVKVTRGETGRSLDEAKFQFFQGEELIDSWDWKQEDRLEADFESLMPIQWVDNRTLHIGGANRKSEFSDEIIVLNNTGEYLKYVSVVYDKDDIYKVFGLAPGNLVTIRASPWFTAKGEEFTFGYTAETRSGKPFENIIKGRERTSANTGPLKFQITIDAN